VPIRVQAIGLKNTVMNNFRRSLALIFRRFGAYFLISFLVTGCFGKWGPKDNSMLGEHRFKIGAHVRVPNGYCIDRQLIVDKPKSSFLAMVPCNEVVASARPGLITLTFARADMEPNRPTMDLLEGLLLKENIEIYHRKQSTSFARPTNAHDVEIYAMQKKPWQAVSIMSQHLVVATLYIPDYILTDQEMAIKRLGSALERVTFSRPDGDIPVLAVSAQPSLLRPMARPQKP
jgi:hypothetical protein